MLNKYDVQNPTQLEEIRKKVTQTNLDKYGVKCNLDIDRAREKALIKSLQTMYKNGTGMCSKQ